MRIGVDMLGAQAPDREDQGAGRYGVRLISALTAREDGHEFFLYVHDDLPVPHLPAPAKATVRRLNSDGESDGLTITQRMDLLARTNPDRLDVLLVLNPFETWNHSNPPARPLNGLKLAAIVHDLNVFLSPPEEVYDPLLMQCYRALDEARRYDLLLAVSESTRRDGLARFDWPADRVVTIGDGEDGEIAARVVRALSELPARGPVPKRRIDRGHPRKPRIAFFSPLPPRKSGISDYSVFLLEQLKQTYAIDLYHDTGYVPDLGRAAADFECRDGRLFERYAAELDYRAVVYQMGNSRYHDYHYEMMFRFPGVVTLHDYCLSGFHVQYARKRGKLTESLRDELLTWYPEDAGKILERLNAWAWDEDEVARGCAREGWYLNRRLLASRNRIVVHSPWCLDRTLATRPEPAARMTVIPFGAALRKNSGAEAAAIRARFEIPRDALMIAGFGFINPDKMGIETIDAFQTVAEREPSALLAFVGEEADGGAVRRHAEASPFRDRVRFLGRRSIAEYEDLVSIADIGINLRRPPTNGETSGALLNLLASGVATIVTDVGTFGDYPDDVVRKVGWEREGLEGLRRAMTELATDGAARRRQGARAWEYVAARHEWSRVARQYVEIIERAHAELSGAGDQPAGRVHKVSRMGRVSA